MKGKIILSALAALLAAPAAIGQGGMQLRGGVNFANVSITDDGSIDEANRLTSFHLGLLGDFTFGEVIALQPGIFFTGKGAKTEWNEPAINSYSKATTNIYYIEVPLNLVLKFPLSDTYKLFAGAGPYAGIGVSGKNRVETRIGALVSNSERNIEFSNDDPTTTDEEEGAGFGRIKRFDYGLNGTAGLESKGAVLAVGYGLGLAKLASGSNSEANDKNKHRVWSISLGFKL